jgi:hypothetical protein
MTKRTKQRGMDTECLRERRLYLDSVSISSSSSTSASSCAWLWLLHVVVVVVVVVVGVVGRELSWNPNLVGDFFIRLPLPSGASSGSV